MRLSRLPPAASPTPGSVRFTGVVDGAGDADGPIWIDVPDACAAEMTGRLDGWLPWLLPHAFETGQDLVLDGPVDARLLRHAHALMEIWTRWRPDRRPVRVHAEADDAATRDGEGPERTGLFFTGGVDSFFTLFHHDDLVRLHPEWRERPVDDLVYVWGFDIPLASPEAYEAKRRMVEEVARHAGKTFVGLATNLRDSGVRRPWGPVMHGPALGGIGLFLGRRWRTMLLSSWFCHEEAAVPWGSTGITDPLFSTAATSTRPHGGGHDRFEKLAYLAPFQIVLDTLHVCWEERSSGNCGRCEKCLRTLLALEVIGVRDRARTFPAGPLPLDRLAAVWKDQPLFVAMYRQLREHAARAGRVDIVAVLDPLLAGSRSPA